MVFILLLLERTAAAETAITVAINMMNPQSASPIETAAKNHNLLFFVYLALIALVTVFTWLVWKSGNKVQDAIRAGADARIEEAKGEAAKANERSTKLENDNLKLRGDLNTESGKVAGLQKDATDAKTEQQRVETDLAKQRALTAKAQKEASDAALALAKFKAPRTLSPEQRENLISALKPFAGQNFALAVFSDPEALALVRVLDALLKSAGWNRVPSQIQRGAA